MCHVEDLTWVNKFHHEKLNQLSHYTYFTLYLIYHVVSTEKKRSGEASTMETSLEHGALESAYMQQSDLLIYISHHMLIYR